MRDVSLLKGRLNRLSGSREKPSKIYELLHGFHYTALIAVSIAGSPEIQKMIDLYLNKLRNVRTVLTGKDLENMGIKSGPHMKEILYELLQARLNGQVTDKQGEIEMVNNTLQQKSN